MMQEENNLEKDATSFYKPYTEKKKKNLQCYFLDYLNHVLIHCPTLWV